MLAFIHYRHMTGLFIPYSESVEIESKSQSDKIFYMYSKHRIDIKDFVTYLLVEADFDSY